MAARRRGKKKASRRVVVVPRETAQGPEPRHPSLEEVIVAFQRSLGRAGRSAIETSRSELGIRSGDQPLYVVDRLDITLSAGLRVAAGREGGAPGRLLVDFDAPEEERSEVSFTVEARPIEVEDERLTLADLDPLGEDWPRARLRATLVGERGGKPLASAKLFLHVSGRATPIPLTTNEFGEVDVEIDPVGQRYRIDQGRRRPLEVDLTRQVGYFAYCTCPDPELQSNVIRLTSRRAPTD